MSIVIAALLALAAIWLAAAAAYFAVRASGVRGRHRAAAVGPLPQYRRAVQPWQLLP